MTTERKSIRAANRNEFGAGSGRLSTVSDLHACMFLYFADPHALAQTRLNSSTFRQSGYYRDMASSRVDKYRIAVEVYN